MSLINKDRFSHKDSLEMITINDTTRSFVIPHIYLSYVLHCSIEIRKTDSFVFVFCFFKKTALTSCFRLT